MRWKKLGSERLIWVSDRKYRINWDKKAPSKKAQEVKDFLRKYCINHVLFEEYPVIGTRLRCDILDTTSKWAGEVQGIQHSEFVPFFHKSRAGYLNSIKRDVLKRQIMEHNGYTFIEIFNDDVVNKEFFVKFGVFIS